MTDHTNPVRPSRLALALALAFALSVPAALATAPAANAATPPVSLGTAADFAVLAAATVTNTGPTVVGGDLGLSPGTAVTGFPPGQLNGERHVADGTAAQAKIDLAAAYTDTATRPTTATVPVELGGTTRTPGVYASPAGTFGITGALTLDAQGDPDAVFVFKTASTLITASASSVSLVNGAQSCNVFWQVGSSATLGTGSTLRGNVLALASITATTGVTVDGRVLARTAAVTLDTATITRATCAPKTVSTSTALTTSAASVVVHQPVTFTAAVTAATGTEIPTGRVTFRDGTTVLAIIPVDSTGRAVFTTTQLAVGSHRITAVYTGSPRFLRSVSPRINQTVTAS